MFNLLAITESSPWSYVVLAFMLLILLAWPFITYRKNKRDAENQNKMVETLKKGDYLLTYSGIFGKVVEVVEKESGKYVVLETGESNKTFVTVSSNAVYMLTNNNPKVYDAQGKEIKKEEAKKEPGQVKEPKTEKKTEKAKKESAEKKPAKTKKTSKK